MGFNSGFKGLIGGKVVLHKHSFARIIQLTRSEFLVRNFTMDFRVFFRLRLITNTNELLVFTNTRRSP